ncbi:proteasome activator subunit 4, partial [Pseudohyphozyma bogoriensis]
MGHLNFSTPANVPGQKGDTPLLDPDLMQLVFSLYSAQVSLHNAHLALNNIETSLHQSALHDPTLLPRAHFAYDALCQTLGLEGVPSLALDSSANPTAANGEATQPPTESTTLDYEKFVKTFTAAFPDSSPPPPSHLPTPSVLLSHQAQAAQDPSAAPVGGSSNSTLSDLLSISSFPPPAS